MRHKLLIGIWMTVAAMAAGQVASHAPTSLGSSPAAQMTSPQVSGKAVARVNGVVLTDRDLLREMVTIFPYAGQHNGFPKAQEANIRRGALEMIIFEELVYQEAGHRKITVPAAQLNKSEAEFRRQFHSPEEYDRYLKAEMRGSRQVLRQQIQRSLMIEEVLKSEVGNKASVSPAEVRAYYEKNAARFQLGESFSFQSISILPPPQNSPDALNANRKRAEAALHQAQATKNYQDFGLLAEKLSEDDFRVNMGDHHAVSRAELPPQIVSAALAMHPGQVSGLIQIENAFTIFRLNAHNPPRTRPFAEVKTDLMTELQKSKYEALRSGLAKKLRANAKIEIV